MKAEAYVLPKKELVLVHIGGNRDRGVVIDGINDSSNMWSKRDNLNSDILVIDKTTIKWNRVSDNQSIQDLGSGKSFISWIR